MKKITLILCFFGDLIAYGQRTIEVKIQDTIELDVTSADLILQIYGKYSDFDMYAEEKSYDYDAAYSDDAFDQELTNKQKRKIRKLTRLLKKQYKKMNLDEAVIEEEVPMEEVAAPAESEGPIVPLDEGQSDFEHSRTNWVEWLSSAKIPMDTLDDRLRSYLEEGSYTILLPNLNAEQIDLVYTKSSAFYGNHVLYFDKASYATIDSKMDVVNTQMVKDARKEAASLAKALNATAGTILRVYNPESQEISCSRGWDEEEYDISNIPTGRCLLMEKTFVFEIK